MFNKKKAKKNRLAEWLDHPVTRRDYAYMYAAALGAYALGFGVMCAYNAYTNAGSEKLLHQKEMVEKMDYANEEEVDI